MNKKYSSEILTYFKVFHKRFQILLNITFIVYAILLPFSDAFSSHSGPWILFIFWILEGNLHKKIRLLLSEKAILWWLLFFIFSLFSLLWTTNIHDGIHTLRYYFAITIVVGTLYTSLDKKFAPWLLYSFLGAMFISEAVSYGIYLDLWHTRRGTPQNPTPFMHHVIYSIFLAVTVILLLGQILNQKNRIWVRALELIFLLSVTGNLFINGGRTGQLAVVFGIIIFIITRYGTKIKYIILTIFVLITVFFTAYLLSPNFQNRVSQGINDIHHIQQGKLNNSWGYRIAMKEVSLQNLSHHLLIGNGIGDVKEAFKETLYKTPLKKYPFLKNILHVHDQYLQIAMQTGIVGLVLFLSFLFCLYKSAYNLSREQRAIFYGTLVIFIVSFFIDVPLRNYSSGLFAFLIGYFLSHLSDSKSLKSKSNINIQI